MTAALLPRLHATRHPAPAPCATTSLGALRRGERAQVLQVGQAGELGERLMEMGLVAGTEVQVLEPGRWGGALRLSVRGYVLSLRAGDARCVEVVPLR